MAKNKTKNEWIENELKIKIKATTKNIKRLIITSYKISELKSNWNKPALLLSS